MKSSLQIDRVAALNRSRAIFALCAVVPVTSIAASMSVWIAPGIVGQSVAVCCGIWMVLFPILWHRFVDRQQLKFNFNKPQGLGVGILLGLGMFGIVAASYWFVGRSWMDIGDIRAKFALLKMNAPLMVFGFGTFQTLLGSGNEEYIWRWFVFQKCEVLFGRSAVWISAIFFTLHHIILILAYTQDLRLIAIMTLAVFIAGVIWAQCFAKYRSILPSYISHLAADLALQIIGWHVLLG
jgi:uncharacterized protein